MKDMKGVQYCKNNEDPKGSSLVYYTTTFKLYNFQLFNRRF